MSTDPAWRRYTLFALLLLLGLMYLVAVNHFRRHSRNFLDSQEQRRAEIAQWPLAPRSLPQHWIFSAGREEARLLGAGWWPAEADGANLIHSPGHVLLPLFLLPGDLRLELILDAYRLPPGTAISARVDGQELARWLVGTEQRLPNAHLVVPAARVRRAPIDLELQVIGSLQPLPYDPFTRPQHKRLLILRELHISAVAPPP